MFNNEEFSNSAIFSTWPSQSINRNESELLIFSKYFDIIDKEAVRKQILQISNVRELRNVDKANYHRSVGNTMYKEKKYDLAVQHYIKSILYVPRDSKEFALAIANRSAAFFDMEKYKECLQDINMAMKSEYPEDLRYKILLRQSKCYLKLNLNVEAAKSIQKAEEYVDKLKSGETQILLRKEAITEIKNQLKDQLGTKVTDVPDNKFINDLILIEPSLKNGNNPKFLNAAQVVDFKYNKKLGRHVVANTDINKGDVLFIEEPYSFVVVDNPWEPGLGENCSFCLQKTLNSIPCTECPWYVYCSDECRLGDWNFGHQWECEGVSRKMTLNPVHRLALYTLFKASYDGFQTTIEDESTYGQKNNYAFVHKLLTNKNKIHEKTLLKLTKEVVFMVLVLKNFTNYFNWLYVQPNRPEGCKEELYKFIGGQLLKYLLQINSNAVKILEGTVYFHPKNFGYTLQMSVGRGIYVSTALLNHACLPNAIQIFDGPKSIIRAKEFIKKGTEVTINYLVRNFYSMKNIEVRQALLKKYAFTCTCSGCTDPTKMETFNVLLCPKCNGRAFFKDLDSEFPIVIKCTDCDTYTIAPAYSMMLTRITELCVRGEQIEDYTVLNEMQRLIENTVHKQNVTFYVPYYNLRILHYNKTGEIKKCAEIAKLNMELVEPSMGDIHSLSMSLTYVYFLIKYCLTLKKQNSKVYKKNMSLAKEMIKKSALLLQYYTSIKNIKKYVADMMKYKNTGYIEMRIFDDSFFCDI